MCAWRTYAFERVCACGENLQHPIIEASGIVAVDDGQDVRRGHPIVHILTLANRTYDDFVRRVTDLSTCDLNLSGAWRKSLARRCDSFVRVPWCLERLCLEKYV